MREPHLPGESWDCADCGSAWPCDQARESLMATFERNPADLAMFMCERLNEAAPELARSHHPDELFDRFIAWTKRRPLDVTPDPPPAHTVTGVG